MVIFKVRIITDNIFDPTHVHYLCRAVHRNNLNFWTSGQQIHHNKFSPLRLKCLLPINLIHLRDKFNSDSFLLRRDGYRQNKLLCINSIIRRDAESKYNFLNVVRLNWYRYSLKIQRVDKTGSFLFVSLPVYIIFLQRFVKVYTSIPSCEQFSSSKLGRKEVFSLSLRACLLQRNRYN